MRQPIKSLRNQSGSFTQSSKVNKLPLGQVRQSNEINRSFTATENKNDQDIKNFFRKMSTGID